MQDIRPFKEPTVVRGKQGWFVKYFYEIPGQPGKYKEFRVKDGVNYVEGLAERETYIQQLRSDVSEALNSGRYNPFGVELDLNQQLNEVQVKIKKKKAVWTLHEAIDKYIEYYSARGHASGTVKAYDRYMRPFRQYAIDQDWYDSPASQLTELQLEEYLEAQGKKMNWKSRTYNGHLSGLQTFLLKAEKMERKVNRGITYNCLLDDIETKNDRAEANEPFNPELAKAIKEELKVPKYHELSDFCEWIFLSLMRPFEVRKLKFYNIDEVSRQISIYGKGGYIRLVPISEPLMSLINKRKAGGYEPNWYIFGETGAVGPKMVGKDQFNERFREIKKKLKLPEKFKCYSWKATGVIALINAGFSDKEIMVLTGHKTQKAFEAYKRGLVIDNSHAMKGHTVKF